MVAFLTVKAYYCLAFSLGDSMCFSCIFCSELYEVVILLFHGKNTPPRACDYHERETYPHPLPVFMKFE